MLEDFLNSLQNFRRNKMRTFLSLLGIIIGVASVIVIMSMGQSSTAQIEQTFGSNGLDMVSLSAGGFMWRGSSSSVTFNDSFREKLFASVPNIKTVWYKNSVSGTISCGEMSSNTSASAVETDYMQSYGLQLEDGHFFDVTDNVMGTQKMILGSEIASTLFPNGDAVGKNVIMVISSVSFNFEVIGVLKSQTSGLEDSSNGCFVTRGFYTKKIVPNAAAATVMVQAVSKDKATTVQNDVNTYCAQLTGSDTAVRTMSMQSMLDQMSQITATVSMLLAAIAAISLLVGGIGIMNIMIVTVTERKQEIGIRKALGASPNKIRVQFLIESASITVLGGIAGIILGIGLSFAVEYVRELDFVISTDSCVIAFVFSVFVGIFFGFSPASRAAKLDPVIALSGE